MKSKIYLLLASSAFSCAVIAQPSLLKMKDKLNLKREIQVNRFEINERISTQASLKMNDASPLSKQQIIPWLSSELELRPGQDALQKKGATVDYVQGLNIERLQQYYKGIKVEHGTIAYTSKGDAVSFVQMEFYPIAQSLRTTPTLTQEGALAKAMSFVGATKYAWEGYTGNDPDFKKPTGELVIVEDFIKNTNELKLAYKFNIAADEPMSRAYIYVDAQNGDVLLVDNIIKHVNANGTADTRYSGNAQPIVTNSTGTTFQLRQTRNNHNITTLDYARRTQSTTNNGLAADFTDTDNNWTTAEHAANYDDAAHDVQYAMQFISDYWKNIHNRNSWNNANGEMRSYVHVRATASAGYDNAFWSGSAMYYGDGTYYSTAGNGTIASASGFKPLTCLDVSAHELGHAVCQSTAALVYARESGGLNEGFSDIWGACVENYSGLPKNLWLLGDELSGNGAPLRDMQNPNVGNQPDTYGGYLWYPTSLAGCPVPNSNLNDNCGVHYNSGVINKWFYILTVGEAGINDLGDAYNVTGLGFAKSQLITFLAEQNLTGNSNYAATRTACINAAASLYGICSNEVTQVANAWFAVGVGNTYSCVPTVEFVKGNNTVTEGTGLAGGCGSKTVSIGIKLLAAATQSTTVNFSFAGGATNNVDYTVPASINFAIGESGTKNLVLTITDDAAVEGNETVAISYTVNANSGNAVAGVNNQSFTLTINDDDVVPSPISAKRVTTDSLIYENFETNVGALPTSWFTQAWTGSTNTTNTWVVGSNGGDGITGQAAYITNSTVTKPLTYSLTSSADRTLRTIPVSTVGYTRLKLKFKYKVEGEYDLSNTIDSALYDFGRLQYSFNGTTYGFLNDPATGLPITLLGKGTVANNFSIDLPVGLENRTALYIGFRWTNDAGAGSNPPLLIDDVVLTGDNIGTSVETQMNQANTFNLVSGAPSAYLYSAVDSQLIARVSNLSTNISCVNASLSTEGNGRVQLNGLGGKYATSKAIKLTPFTANTTATYNASFYFTADELAVWGADKTTLKILKIKEGTLPTDNLNAGNSQIITPTLVTDNSATTGVIIYTADFTGFSQFRLVESATVLPVLLTDLKVTLVKEDAQLSWKTAQEFNNKGFEILKSFDGVHFEKIDFAVGKGTTTAANDYSFTDKTIKPNVTIYYRLRQVDFDGKSVESNTVTVKLTKGNSYISFIRPNPAHDVVNVNFTNQVSNGKIVLLNAAGQVLMIKTITQSSIQIPLDIKQLPAGAYFIEVSDGDVTERHRLIKN